MSLIKTKATGWEPTAHKRLNNKKYSNLPHKKPLPPFGKKIEVLLTAGQLPKNNIWAFIGVQAWQKAKAFEASQFVLVLPCGVDPGRYRWPVKGCSLLIFNTGGIDLAPSVIRKFGFVLLASGAHVVHIILLNGPMVIYRREVK